MRFDHDLTPTTIVFGRGRLAELPTVAAEVLNGRAPCALVVCGRTAMRTLGVLDRVTELLESAGIEAVVHDAISANPRSDEVDAGIAVLRARGAGVVIGLGGGSALDAAKAVAVGAGYSKVSEIIGRTLPASPDTLPMIAIPTTAGSGSEITKGAIITDVTRDFRSGIRGPDLFPRAAIVDPELVATMPRAVAAETAFDALTHAVESHVARRANPINDPLAVRAVELINRHSHHLAPDAAGLVPPAAWDDLCLAALLGGLNVATASTCLPHRLQQAMGSVPRVSVSHGRGLATVYPAWLRHAHPFASARFDEVTEPLGEGAVAALERTIDRLGVRTSMSGLGFAESDVDALVAGVNGNLDNDPIDAVDGELLRALYRQSW
jgi:alcohol dehydrogenase class IV